MIHQLIQVIESIRGKLESYRRLSLKETPTRTIIIDPLLEALGWDVRDPDEVQLEYPTVDGKSVDYALMINGKPTLLVEAKSLDDALNDVKAITQVVGYAANDGIVWCVLTNGVKWKVYRSVEKCPAPDKLMFEVSFDPHETEGLTVQQIAEQMWRFSREEMAKGTLDTIGEQTFTDGKVRKALDSLVREPPRAFLNLVRTLVGDENLAPQRIKESLARVWSQGQPTAATEPAVPPSGIVKPDAQESRRSAGARKAWETRKGKPPKRTYDEAEHTFGKPQEVLELYLGLDRFCSSLGPEEVEKQCRAKHIGYRRGKSVFCSVHLQQSGLRVWLKLKYGRLENAPDFARDVSATGHWGVGDLELGITNMSQLEESKPLIRMSFEASG
ncbi:MAG: hypothetical protein HY318_19815 [Armatimonadetes bacterium]|nr:hypothetical protein [Armatimonadota bacterium]